MADYSKQEVLDIVDNAARTHNIPREDFLRFTAIETGFTYDERAVNPYSGAKGLFQFLPDTARQYGIAGRELDPNANADAGARLYIDNRNDIIASHGRSGRPYLSGEAQPNGLDLYMAHQQGAYGYRSIQAALDPNFNRFFNDTDTRGNILANIGDDVERLTGVRRNQLSGLNDHDLAQTFVNYWETKYNRIAIPEKGIAPIDASQPAPTQPQSRDPNSGTLTDTLLVKGEDGPGVKRLQESLNAAGVRVNGQPLPTTGHFGDQTEAAVRQFQQQRGLEVDGKAGRDTLTALGIQPGQAQTTPQPAPQTPSQTQTPSQPQPAPQQPAPQPQTTPGGNTWPAPGNFNVNRADKPGEGEGEFGTPRAGGRDHKGIDIQGKVGDPIESFGPGRVIFSGQMQGYGNTVVIQHDNGLQTLYGHLNSRSAEVGQRVTENTVIGTMGRSGNTPSQGDTHLHFEVRENSNGVVLGGQAVDPRKYLEFPPRTLLVHGDQGPDVRHLQEALNASGVRVNGQQLPTTGYFGDQTEAAVKQYQTQHGLQPVDGKAGRDTLTALGIYPGQQQTTPTPQQPTQQAPQQTPNPQPQAPDQQTPAQQQAPQQQAPQQQAPQQQAPQPQAPQQQTPNPQPQAPDQQAPAQQQAPQQQAPQQQAPQQTPTPTPQVPPTSSTDRPPSDPAQPQRSAETERPSIADPRHPDHRLYEQAMANLQQLGPSGGFKSQDELTRAAAAVAADARASGLNSIDHVAKTNTPNGQTLLVAVEGNPTNPASKNSYIDYGQATTQ
ncbi:MAG: peptidoglycan-binding protein, partial [Lysobacteraceae bacterium]